MTGGSEAQSAQPRNGELCRQHHCSLDTERGLGDWTLWFGCWECDAEKWILVTGSWDCDWRHSKRPWGLFYVLVYGFQRNTVERNLIDESVWPNEPSSGSLDSLFHHQTACKHLSRGWHDFTTHCFCAASRMASTFQYLFPCLHLASSLVPFSGHCLWPTPFCWLPQVRKHLCRCENVAGHPPCSWMWHHHDIYIEHICKILTIPLCTQLCTWIGHAEWGFCLIWMGLHLEVGTSLFPSLPSHSIEKLFYVSYVLVPCRGEQAWITRLHCTCGAVRGSS
jgi:hypothetical protein